MINTLKQLLACKKLVSWLTLMTFFFNCIGSQAVFGLTTRDSVPVTLHETNIQPLVPSQYGMITGGAYAGGTRLVVFIQDLHCNPEVQGNIAHIIQSFNNRAEIKRIFLEGAPSGKVKTNLFGTVADKGLREKAFDLLLRKGFLSGAEYYALKSGRDSLFGLEEWSVYNDNVDRYRRLFQGWEQNEQTCQQMQKKINQLKNSHAASRLKRPDKLLETGNKESRYALLAKIGARAGEPIGGYPNLSRHISLIRLNRTIKTGRLNGEFTAFFNDLRKVVPMRTYRMLVDGLHGSGTQDEHYLQLGEVAKIFNPALLARYPEAGKFIAAVNLKSQINPIHLIGEEELYKERIQEKMTRSKLDRDILFLSRMAGYMGDYAALQLTPSRFRYFSAHREGFKLLLQKYFEPDDISAALALLDDGEIARYYAVNLERNDIFAREVSRGGAAADAAALRAPDELVPGGYTAVLSRLSQFTQIDIMVAGGFHAEVTDALMQRGISCLTITPAVTRVTDQSLYTELMTDTVDPQRVLSSALGPVLLLARKPADPEILALFSSAKTLEEAQALVNDLQADPEIKLNAVLDNNNTKMSVTVNGRFSFSLEQNPERTVTLVTRGLALRNEQGVVKQEGITRDFDPGIDALNDVSEAVTAAMINSREIAKLTTSALIELVHRIFRHFFRTPSILHPLLTMSDMDETLLDLDSPITPDSMAVLIEYLRSGGHKLIITGASFDGRKGVEQRLLIPLMEALGETEKHLLGSLHVMVNSGAEHWEFDPESGVYELVEQSDLEEELGEGVEGRGKEKVSAIRSILLEVVNGSWTGVVRDNANMMKKLRVFIQGLVAESQQKNGAGPGSAFLNAFPPGHTLDDIPDDALIHYLTGIRVQINPNSHADIYRYMKSLEAGEAVAMPSSDDETFWSEYIDPRRGDNRKSSQITFVAAGRNASKESRVLFDPMGVKRTFIAWYINERFRMEGVRVLGTVAGTTSIDIRPVGRDKGYAVRKFVAYYFEEMFFDLDPKMMGKLAKLLLRQSIFMGDSLCTGGHDISAARLAKFSIQVQHAHTNEVDRKIEGKVVDTAELGAESLIPFIRILSIIAKVHQALARKPEEEDDTLNGVDVFEDVFRDLGTLPMSLMDAFMNYLVPAHIIARAAKEWASPGTEAFQSVTRRDPFLASTLPGKSVLHVMPAVNPSFLDAGEELAALNRASGGLPAVMVRITAGPAEINEEKIAGKIILRHGSDTITVQVRTRRLDAGTLVSLRIPERFLPENEDPEKFLKSLYPSGLDVLVEALTNGDILAENTKIVPWAVVLHGMNAGPKLRSLPVVVSDDTAASYEEMARQYRDKLLTPGQERELNAGTGVMRQGAVLLRVDIGRVHNPNGPDAGTAENAAAFLRQSTGLAGVQFDGLFSIADDGKIVCSPDMGIVVAKLKEVDGARMVFSVRVPDLPVGEEARTIFVSNFTDGIVAQLRDSPSLGIRMMHNFDKESTDFQYLLKTVADKLRDAGIAPDTPVYVDCLTKKQVSTVHKAITETGMTGLRAVQGAKTASEVSGDAVEVTIHMNRAAETTDRNRIKSQLISVMNAPNAQTIVVHLAGDTPSMGQQDCPVNLSLFIEAVSALISSRRPMDPRWWHARGVQVAGVVFKDLLNTVGGDTDAQGSLLRRLADAMIAAQRDTDRTIESHISGLAPAGREILINKLQELRTVVIGSGDQHEREVRGEMMTGFLDGLLSEALYHQLAVGADLDDTALREHGEDVRLKHFLAVFARSAAGETDNVLVELLQMQAGRIALPAENERAQWQRNFDNAISRYNKDPAVVFAIRESAAALDLAVFPSEEREQLINAISATGYGQNTAGQLVAEFLAEAHTAEMASLRNKITAFLNQDDRDPQSQAVALALYLAVLKVEFNKGFLQHAADYATPAAELVRAMLSAA